jgi:hypothetical protein
MLFRAAVTEKELTSKENAMTFLYIYLAIGFGLVCISETDRGPMLTTNPVGAALLVLIWPAAVLYYIPHATKFRWRGKTVWEKAPQKEAPSMREMREAMARRHSDLPPPWDN